MGRFEQKKDARLFQEEIPGKGESRLVVEVYSYDHGAPGMQLTRLDKDGNLMKRGRIGLAEVRALSAMLPRVLAVMEAHGPGVKELTPEEAGIKRTEVWKPARCW